MDAGANSVLKGHLFIEEKLTEIVETMVFHPKYLDSARLSFAQKLILARSICRDQHEEGMWEVIGKLNAVRNALAHSLDTPKRDKAFEALIVASKDQIGQWLEYDKSTEDGYITAVVIMSLMFLEGVLTMTGTFKEAAVNLQLDA